MRGSRYAVALVALSLWGASLSGPSPTMAASARREPVGVIALTDSGINPYHRVFRDESPRAYKHPSTYLPGYPRDAKALRIMLEPRDYGQAALADCKRIWQKVKPGKLYWIPGTRIIGAMSRGPQTHEYCEGARILDENGHGTMTASRAAGFGYGACPDCLIVSIQMPGGLDYGDPEASTDHAVDSITWAAANSDWIDIQSNSWGPLAPGWDPSGKSGLAVGSPRFVRSVEKVSRKHLAFWASGNGVAWRFGVAGHPTQAVPHMTPSAILVGGHDSGHVTPWTGFSPHLISDACNSWGALHKSLRDSGPDVGGGTSAASPFAAGGALRILTDARKVLGDTRSGVRGKIVAAGQKGIVAKGPLADGKLTLDEWRRLVFATASERPERQREDGSVCPIGDPYETAPVKWTDVPEAFPEYVQIGYGAVDRQSIARAADVLRGRKPLPDRSDTDTFFEIDRTARETTYEVFSRP